MVKIYKTFSSSYKLHFPGFSGKGMFETGKHKIEKQRESSKNLTSNINIQIGMSYLDCFSISHRH